MGAATIHNLLGESPKIFYSVFKLTLLQDLRFSQLLPSGQVVKDQLTNSGKLRQRTVRKGILKKYNKLCTYGSRSHKKRVKEGQRTKAGIWK